MFGQAVAPGLERHCVADDLLDSRLCGTGAQLGAQIDLVIAQQAQVQTAISSQSHSIACRTERVADRADKAELALRARDAKAPGRVGAANPSGSSGPNGFELGDQLS
jgi:hypothetical protein